jgi:hypothetical protein
MRTRRLAWGAWLTIVSCGGLAVVDGEGSFYPDNPCGSHADCDTCERTDECVWLVPGQPQPGCGDHEVLPAEGCYPAGDCDDGCGAGRRCTPMTVRSRCVLCSGANVEPCLPCMGTVELCLPAI